MSGFNKQVFQKEIDVWIQDQATAPFHRYFMTVDIMIHGYEF